MDIKKEDMEMTLANEIKSLVQGKSEEQAEKILAKKYGSIPDVWFDPIERTNLLGQEEVGQTVVNAHMSNFEQAYGGNDRLGSNALGVGFRRNVEGQGMPGSDTWLKEKVKGNQSK